ncbi:hypothetical protein M23134_00557 [Microscilla marina ATCC 23134]|uniref:Uncharacterized protein n=1 Tax=Microscilla marina ATCC 23134 TaxID=313606 RepID=A1ZJD7_MICM2|nr:hypothetical protein M23134_00557 [Microscilla marina ATCC 23134]
MTLWEIQIFKGANLIVFFILKILKRGKARKKQNSIIN